MQNKHVLKRTSVLGVAILLALLLVVGAYVVAVASPAPAAEPGLTAASNGASWYDSGWQPVAPGTPCRIFVHNLGRHPDAYAVELWFKDTDVGGIGINRVNYGGAQYLTTWHGAYWQRLTPNTVQVCRGQHDTAADEVRVRVWVPPVPTSDYYDSGWAGINQGQTIEFSHNVGITDTDLSVGLWFSSTIRGIHHFGFGGLANGLVQELWGAHWSNLTNNTIRVTRHPNDPFVEEVRVIVTRGDPPAYDSLDASGGWQPIAPDTEFTFEHNLGWSEDMLLVRGECFSSTFGIHQLLAGGNYHWSEGWKGVHLQDVTSNTVTVVRRASDDVCPYVRVRIWKRSVRTYLPVVLK